MLTVTSELPPSPGDDDTSLDSAPTPGMFLLPGQGLEALLMMRKQLSVKSRIKRTRRNSVRHLPKSLHSGLLLQPPPLASLPHKFNQCATDSKPWLPCHPLSKSPSRSSSTSNHYHPTATSSLGVSVCMMPKMSAPSAPSATKSGVFTLVGR